MKTDPTHGSARVTKDLATHCRYTAPPCHDETPVHLMMIEHMTENGENMLMFDYTQGVGNVPVVTPLIFFCGWGVLLLMLRYACDWFNAAVLKQASVTVLLVSVQHLMSFLMVKWCLLHTLAYNDITEPRRSDISNAQFRVLFSPVRAMFHTAQFVFKNDHFGGILNRKPGYVYVHSSHVQTHTKRHRLYITVCLLLVFASLVYNITPG